MHQRRPGLFKKKGPSKTNYDEKKEDRPVQGMCSKAFNMFRVTLLNSTWGLGVVFRNEDHHWTLKGVTHKK